MNGREHLVAAQGDRPTRAERLLPELQRLLAAQQQITHRVDHCAYAYEQIKALNSERVLCQSESECPEARSAEISGERKVRTDDPTFDRVE